jgi:hypothetical protein
VKDLEYLDHPTSYLYEEGSLHAVIPLSVTYSLSFYVSLTVHHDVNQFL